MRDENQITSTSQTDGKPDHTGIGLEQPNAVFSGLTEMMRSFVVLADCLNLTHAVDRLQTTRQTVRRHIKLLETARGAPLFEVRDRQYSLTEAGRQALPEAEYILGRSQAWYRGQIGRIAGLDAIHRDAPHPYFLQQHSLAALWRENASLLQRGLIAWAEAKGDLEHASLVSVRRYMTVFRRYRSEWICFEVGPESSFARWYGQAWERSSVGRPLGEMPGGRTFSRVANRPYDEIEATHGVRYDHIHTMARHGETGLPSPISFKRLLLGCRLADGSFALGNLVQRSHDLQIDGLDPAIVTSMPRDQVEDLPMA